MDMEVLISAVGNFFLVYVVIKVLLFIWRMVRLYILPSYGFAIDLRRYGQWAVVTGATDGIGQAYAQELARRGMKILLISRSIEKLEKASRSIRAETGVETKTICFDFSASSDYSVIENEIRGMDIGILVNNVGMSHGTGPNFYSDIDISLLKKVVDVNIMPEVQLTHMVLSGMTMRKRGMIIHISSGSMHLLVPFRGIYPSTKMFISYFSRVLQLEASALENVHHQLVIPHYVATKMSQKPQAFNCPSASAYVKSAVNTIGLSSEVSGYWIHELERVFFGFVPAWLVLYVASNALAKAKKAH